VVPSFSTVVLAVDYCRNLVAFGLAPSAPYQTLDDLGTVVPGPSKTQSAEAGEGRRFGALVAEEVRGSRSLGQVVETCSRMCCFRRCGNRRPTWSLLEYDNTQEDYIDGERARAMWWKVWPKV
jgi:hypothetical protein